MIHGVIFDMDGLMFDTERMWATFWQPALSRLGLAYPQGLDEAARGTAGETMYEVLRRFFGPDCDAVGIAQALHDVADETFMHCTVPKKPGLDELLAFLHARGIPMAVASSSKQYLVRHHLAQWGLERYFSAVISGEMAARSKPCPDIFLLAAERLGAAPGECLVLEDSYNGVRAGAAGGFITVMVPDLLQPDEEIRALCAAVCPSLGAVRTQFDVLGR